MALLCASGASPSPPLLSSSFYRVCLYLPPPPLPLPLFDFGSSNSSRRKSLSSINFSLVFFLPRSLLLLSHPIFDQPSVARFDAPPASVDSGPLRLAPALRYAAVATAAGTALRSSTARTPTRRNKQHRNALTLCDRVRPRCYSIIPPSARNSHLRSLDIILLHLHILHPRSL